MTATAAAAVRLALWAGTLALLAPGCAARSGTGAVGAETWVREELYFGAEIPTGGEVSEADWQAFVAEEIAPRLPNGFSVVEASGHWRHPDGRPIRERTRILVVMRENEDRAVERFLAQIAEAYAARFEQDAVMRTSDRVRVRFVGP